MKIIFARHGESQANLLHVISNRGLKHSLTQRGCAQAESLAERLQSLQITHIFSSPVPRAVETSAIIALRRGISYEVVDALREFDCGIIEGRSDEAAWQEMKELYGAWVYQHRYTARIEGGESFDEVCQRFVPFIQRLMREYSDSPDAILCISHGGIYTSMLPLVVQNVDLEMVIKHGFDYTSYLISELVKDGLICTEWDGRPI